MAVLYLGSWATRQSALTRVVPSKIMSSFYSLWYFLCIGAVNATFWIAWNRVTNQFNDCYKTCRDLKIIVGGRNMNKVTVWMILMNFNLIWHYYRRKTTRDALTSTLRSGFWWAKRITFTLASHYWLRLADTSGCYLGCPSWILLLGLLC